jgi:hypothetical protein
VALPAVPSPPQVYQVALPLAGSPAVSPLDTAVAPKGPLLTPSLCRRPIPPI